MPRFHFHVVDGSSHRDESGAELADIGAARAYALRYLADVMAAPHSAVWSSEGLRMEVTDEAGLVLFGLYLVAIEAPAVTGLRNPDMLSAEPVNG